jgi:hypothetical protein
MGEFWYGASHILVFMRDGKVQRAVSTWPANLAEGYYGSWVILRGRPGWATLEVVEGP